MKRFPPGFPAIMLLLFALTWAGAIGLAQHERRQAGRILSALRDKAAEREHLLAHVPALSVQNEQRVAQERTEAERILSELRSTLPSAETDRLVSPPPARPVDAFFAIAAWVESTRAALSEAGIGVAPHEKFGFAAYATEGPSPVFLLEVHRQRLLAQQVMRSLIAARPREFLGLRRESPVNTTPADKNGADDFFPFDPGLSLRQPGQLETAACRVEFSGQTAALREFLNRLAADARSLVVRSVEVEPLSSAVPATVTGKSSPVPLVQAHLSKFAVIVEGVFLPASP